MTDERDVDDVPADALFALQTAPRAVTAGLDNSSAIVSAVDGAWRGEPDVFVAHVTRYLVEVAGADAEVANDVAELLAAVAADERALDLSAIDQLSDLGDADPDVLRWLFDRLSTSAHPETGGLDATTAATIVAAIGRAGVETPGVATEAIPTLVAWVDAANPPVSVEAMWTLARLYHAEPEVVRPFVAERAWQLDAEDGTAVAEALAELGAVGWAVPDAVAGVERIRDHLTHPDAAVREAAARAVGRIGGQPPVEGERRGRAAPDVIADFPSALAGLLDDPERDVRSAAAVALEAIAREVPAAVVSVRETLVAAVESTAPSAVDAAAVRTMAHLVSHVDDVDPAAWALPMFERLLAADDADPEAYRAAGAGVAAVAGATQADCSTAIIDALRPRPTYGDDDREPAAGPVPALAGCVDELDAVVENACAALDDDDEAVRLAAVRVLGEFVTCDPRTRETILAGLDERLADEEPEVRRTVYTVLVDLVREEPETHGVVANMLREHLHYGDDRGAAVDVLASADNAPLAIAEAIAVLCDLPHSDEKSRESVADAVSSLATGVPEAAVLATGALAERLDGRDAVSTAAARALTVALDAGATLDASAIERLSKAARDDASPVGLRRAAALGIITAGEDDTGAERERLCALMYEDPGGLDALDIAAEHAVDDLETVVSCVAYANANVNRAPTVVGAVGAVSLENAVHAQRTLENYASTVFGQAGSVTAFDGLDRLAERFPHAVPSTAATPRVLLLSAHSEAARSSLNVAAARNVLPESIRERWRHHPVPAVRERVADVEAALDEWSVPEIDPAAVDRTALDETAAALAAPTADAEADVCDLLVDIAANAPSLESHVCEHLLLRFAALDAGERRAGVADALLDVLPDSERAAAVTGDERALVTAMDAPSAAVRAKALAAVASLRTTPSERLAKAALAHVNAEESVVREHAMSAVSVAVRALDGDAIPVDSVVERLSDDANVANTSQSAFRSVVMAVPECAPALADALEARLDGVEHIRRDTKQVAALLLGCVARADPTLRNSLPDALLPLLEEDGSARGAALFALQLAPVNAVADPEDAAKRLCLALRDERDETDCYAAGDFFERLARHKPAAVNAHLATLADALAERDAVQSIVAERTAYRVLAVLLDEGEATVDPFADLLRRITKNPVRHHTADNSVSRADRDALARAATAAAGRAGLGCYVNVLDPDDGIRETPDPDVTAQFLLVTDDANRADALEAIGGYGQSVRCDVVRAVLERIDTRPGNDTWPATVDVLNALLTQLDDTAIRREGVAAVVAALDASDGDVRRRAAETLTTFVRRDVLPAEEAVAHLFGVLADANRDVRSAAADALADVTRAAQLPDTFVAESLAVRTSSASDEALRCGGATALGVLGVRSLHTRSRAVDALSEATEDGARSVRRAAIRALANIARVDGDAVAVVAKRIRSLAVADDPSLREDARRCLHALDT